MINRLEEVLSNLKNEDVPLHFLILDLLLIYFIIYFTIKLIRRLINEWKRINPKT